MKSIIFNKEVDKEIIEKADIVDLKNMNFLYFEEDDKTTDEESLVLKLVFAGRTEDDKLVIFCTYYKLSKDPKHTDAKGAKNILSSRLYLHNGNTNMDLVILHIIDFFLSAEEFDSYNTDFVTSYNIDLHKYIFTGYYKQEDGNISVKRFAISRDMLTGLNIMNRSIRAYNVSDTVICTVNNWLYTKQTVFYYDVTNYKIMDISKSIKRNGFYTGVVAFKFFTKDTYDNADEANLIIPYMRDKKLRRGTMKFQLMETVYEESLTVSSLMGQSIDIDCQTFQIIANDTTRDRILVFNISKEMHDSFISDINRL